MRYYGDEGVNFTVSIFVHELLLQWKNVSLFFYNYFIVNCNVLQNFLSIKFLQKKIFLCKVSK